MRLLRKKKHTHVRVWTESVWRIFFRFGTDGYQVKAEAKRPSKSTFLPISPLANKIKNEKKTQTSNTKSCPKLAIVRMVGWEPHHPVILKTDFQVFGKQETTYELSFFYEKRILRSIRGCGRRRAF